MNSDRAETAVSGRSLPGVVGLGCLLLLAAGCAGPTLEVAIPDPYPVEVTGQGYAWHFRYPGPDGELGNGDDLHTVGEAVLPAGTETELRLTSLDYIYMFGLPDHDAKEIALPDKWYVLRFTPERPGTFRFEGDQMCGISHEDLNGRLEIRTPDAYRRWVSRG